MRKNLAELTALRNRLAEEGRAARVAAVERAMSRHCEALEMIERRCSEPPEGEAE